MHSAATLERLQISRWLVTSRASTWYLHGFSDASQHAYAAAIYAVMLHDDSPPKATLLAAKSKVAQLKTFRILRLELCGALLLARLIEGMRASLLSPSKEIYCWSDSQVDLAWLSSHSRGLIDINDISNVEGKLTVLLAYSRQFFHRFSIYHLPQ